MLKSTLQQTDPEIYNIIQKEAERQEYGIELIASENYTSKAVMEAMGSVLTNKYSEGYVGKRYYGGNEVIDEMEALAIDRCKKLFGCDHVNIQPLSGSPANAAVYFAVLKPGDKVLGLKLDHGGHLSHGHPVNFSGMLYNFVQYESLVSLLTAVTSTGSASRKLQTKLALSRWLTFLTLLASSPVRQSNLRCRTSTS